jgi:hypothetical protein
MWIRDLGSGKEKILIRDGNNLESGWETYRIRNTARRYENTKTTDLDVGELLLPRFLLVGPLPLLAARHRCVHCA